MTGRPVGGMRRAAGLPGIAAVAALAYVVCDLLHELGHAAATRLPLGVTAVSISTIGLSSLGSSAVIAAAGPLVNLALSVGLLLALVPALSPAGRYFAWLLGTVNLFNATAYLLYSAVFGAGDWGVVFGSWSLPSLWRPVAGFVGLACYAASVRASLHALRRLVAAGIVAGSNVHRYLTTTYWVGGCLLTAGAALNPVSPWFILTSGAATGFGAMAGLLFLPSLLRKAPPRAEAPEETLQIGRAWVLAGAAAAAVFLGVFGRGLRLS